MSEEYEWNGLRVRRDEQHGWEMLDDSVWINLTYRIGSVTDDALIAIAAELDKLYPLPRKVTLDNGDVWTWQENEGRWFIDTEATGMWTAQSSSMLANVLDTLDSYQNGDDR